MSRAIPVEVTLDADVLEPMVRKHVDRLMDELGRRCDMRAVVIVEFWAMMAGGLPYGTYEYCSAHLYVPGGPPPFYTWEDDATRRAWAAEYAARPRLEGV